ncbi:MAG: sigma-70 family RNA polymerase sigma factor [Cyclobacteriaceae bacterium]|nr:sigma-70 family RNA polymerase sigma factor [Cyclobacteriaceae bacterium]
MHKANVNNQPAEVFSQLNTFNEHEKFYQNKKDEEVWSLFKNGNEIAFVHIYKTHFYALFRYGSQFTSNRECIKDAIHDLFLELKVKRQKLSSTDNIRFYLLKSLKIRLISLLKKESKFVAEKSDYKGMDFEFSIPVEELLINRQIDEERRNKLNDAIMKLTNRQREIIFYFYYEGFTLDKIQELMQFESKKATQNLLYKTLAILRSRLSVVEILFILALVKIQ